MAPSSFWLWLIGQWRHVPMAPRQRSLEASVTGPPHFALEAVLRFLDAEAVARPLQSSLGDPGVSRLLLDLAGGVALPRCHRCAQEALGLVPGLGLVLVGVGAEHLVGGHVDRSIVTRCGSWGCFRWSRRRR